MAKTAHVPPSQRDYPSSPAVLPNYVLYSKNTDNDRQYAVSLVSERAMRRVLEIFKEEAGEDVSAYHEDGTTYTHRVGSVVLKMSGNLDAVLNHTIDSEYRLADNYEKSVRAFVLGQTRFVGDGGPPPVGVAEANKNSGAATGRMTSDKPNSEGPAKKGVTTRVVKTGANSQQTARSATKSPGNRAIADGAAKDEVADKLASVTGKDALMSLAKANGFYKESYENLGPGQLRMTVGNVIRGRIKKGTAVKW